MYLSLNYHNSGFLTSHALVKREFKWKSENYLSLDSQTCHWAVAKCQTGDEEFIVAISLFGPAFPMMKSEEINTETRKWKEK